MRVLFLALLLTLSGSLQFRLWKTGGLFQEYRTHQQKIEVQRAHNESLRERNRALAVRLQGLSDDNLAAVEGNARYQLGMIRRDETFYWIIGED